MVPHLLLVGVGDMGRPYLTAIRNLGVKVTAIDLPAGRTRPAVPADRVVHPADRSDEGWAAAVQLAAADSRFDGVLAFSEPHVLAAAMLADRLGLPGPSLYAAVTSRNKALQRGIFAGAGLPQPDFFIAGPHAPESDLVAWAMEHFPVVVKPVDGAGSAGVTHVSTRSHLCTALEGRAGRTILLERALSGQEYSWEGIVRDGKILFGNVTLKETTGPPHFVEVLHRVACLDDGTADKLPADVIAAIGMRTGIVHLEFIRTPDGPAIIEVAVRTPGDHIMDLVDLAYGFDPFEILVSLALAQPVPALPDAPSAYAASWFPTHCAGRVRTIRGLEEIRACPAVVREALQVQPGDVLREPESSADRLGYVLFQASSWAELDSSISSCRRVFAIETEPTYPDAVLA